MQRVCRTCVSSRKSKSVSRPTGSGAAPKHQTSTLSTSTWRQRKRGGARRWQKAISFTSTDDANGKKGAAHEARGADNRKRLAMREKAEALKKLKTIEGTNRGSPTL